MKNLSISLEQKQARRSHAAAKAGGSRGAGVWAVLRGFMLAAVISACCAMHAHAQKTFATPEEAVSALVEATRTGSTQAVVDVLGKGAKNIVQSGDPVADRTALDRFSSEYGDANRIDRRNDTTATLSIGKDDWPFPFPVEIGRAHV